MKRFVEGENRNQSTLFPERLDEYIAEDKSVGFIDVFADGPDLARLRFDRVQPQAAPVTTRQPSFSMTRD